jgi:TPR repeat protein
MKRITLTTLALLSVCLTNQAMQQKNIYYTKAAKLFDKQEYLKARLWLKRVAKLEDIPVLKNSIQESMTSESRMTLEFAQTYYYGSYGITPNFEKAVKLLTTITESAHSSEHAAAYELLGNIYSRGGHGVKRNYKDALSYAFQAAKCADKTKKSNKS